MTTTTPLESLFQKIGIDKFLTDYYEKKHLLLKKACDLREFLFTPEDLMSFLRVGPDSPNHHFSMNRTDRELARSAYSDSTGALQLSRVLQLFDGGVTIYTNWLQQYSNNVLWLARHLERQLQCRINVNLYHTPKNSRGFAVHHDEHDVIIIQVKGRKHWKIYNFDLDKPVNQIPWELTPGTRQLQHEITVEEGDILYVPRGMAHVAHCDQEEPSFALTVGVHPMRWVEVITRGMRLAASEHVELREALPREAWHQDGLHGVQQQADQLLEQFKGWLSTERVGHILRDTYPNRAQGTDILQPIRDTRSVEPNSLFHLDRELSYEAKFRRLNVERAFAQNLVLKRECQPAIDYIHKTKEFSPEALPGLGADDQTALCHHLWRCGMILRTD